MTIHEAVLWLQEKMGRGYEVRVSFYGGVVGISCTNLMTGQTSTLKKKP